MRKLTCTERDEILKPDLFYEGWEVESSLTDPSGEFGEPKVMTVWKDGTRRIKDIRFPQVDYSYPDVKRCEHYELDKESEDEWS